MEDKQKKAGTSKTAKKPDDKKTAAAKSAPSKSGAKSSAPKTKNIKAAEAAPKRQKPKAQKPTADRSLDYDTGGAAVKRQSGARSTITSVVFWTVIFAAILLLIGFNVFNTRPVSPDMAKADIAAESQVRYGDESKLSFGFDKPVDFGGDKDVVWTVDGVEVQRGSTAQKGSMVLRHKFKSVGKHRVEAKVEGCDNLVAQSEVEVLKPCLTVSVGDCQKTYGDENPSPVYEISGFADNDTVNTLDLKVKVSFDADKTSPVGEYEAKCDASHPKYDIVVKGGRLKVLPRRLTVKASAADKIYDGNNNVPYPEFSVGNLAEGDSVGVSCKSASYDDKTVGKNKRITVQGMTITGKAAGNYALPDNIVLTGEIKPKNITLEGAEVSDKYYDGLTSATFRTAGHFNGVADGDEVGIGEISARFETAAVGKQKRVVVERVLLSGKDAGNYVLQLPDNLTASINGDQSMIKNSEVLDRQ